jgi:hypothetical protein
LENLRNGSRECLRYSRQECLRYAISTVPSGLRAARYSTQR